MEKHNIFRVSVDTEHFKKTIEKDVQYSDIADYLTAVDKLALGRGKNPIVKCWGSPVGEKDVNIPKFDKMQNGDEILFYRSFKYVAHAKIVYPTRNVQLARYLWKDKKPGVPFELMYFLTDVERDDVDRSVINDALGYKPNAIVQGLSKVSDETARQFLEKYGSVAAFVDALPQKKQLNTNRPEHDVTKARLM